MTIRHRLSRGLLRMLLSRIRSGTIVVTWSDGSVEVLSADDPGGTAVVVIADETRLLRALAEKGSLGFGAAYVEGVWHTTDLPALLELVSLSIDADDPTLDGKFKRMWHYYLAYCEAGFRTGRVDGVQFSALRIDN